MRRFIFLAFLPILLMGATTVSQNLNIDVTQQAQTGTCPMGSAYADGCSGAPTGTPQYPTLLTQYGANRPPWNVPGVDYYVGIPAGQTLTAWTTAFASCIGNPGSNCTVGGGTWQWNSTYSLLECSAGNAVLNGIDFTAGTIPGYSFYWGAPGCSSLTITNSKIGCLPAVGTGQNAPAFGGFNVQGNTSLTFRYNSADYSNCIGSGGASTAGLWDWSEGCSSCAMDIEYNYFKDLDNTSGIFSGTMLSFIYKYNVVENPATCYSTCTVGQVHMNSLSWGSGKASNVDISFNMQFNDRSYEGNGEFIQVYYNGGGTLTAPVNLSNNVFPYSSAGFSNILHGSSAPCCGSPTSLSGSPIMVNQNYFDLRNGNGNAFYAGSFNGWSASGNINMMTGATITPQ
jgi:hypothetical protein